MPDGEVLGGGVYGEIATNFRPATVLQQFMRTSKRPTCLTGSMFLLPNCFDDSSASEEIFPQLANSDYPTSAWIALGAGETCLQFQKLLVAPRGCMQLCMPFWRLWFVCTVIVVEFDARLQGFTEYCLMS